ncbi:MAG: hypothetical protein CL431_05470 [Acidimicrobiaceae bacterium]|jgi:putative sterol carrier protein|nr:hypothetical protein [Acidimicrobiaceae bacterium]|tara:strand:- start:55488 stop:55820 length:333 start_codon:yes stop_codon:yes gene_type:complete
MGFDEVQWVSELQKNLSSYASPNIEKELIVQYEVIDTNGNVESFHCTLSKTAEASSGSAESPDIIFTLDKGIAISIHKGELTTEEAFLKGLLRMSGDVERLVEAFPSFTQ